MRTSFVWIACVAITSAACRSGLAPQGTRTQVVAEVPGEESPAQPSEQNPNGEDPGEAPSEQPTEQPPQEEPPHEEPEEEPPPPEEDDLDEPPPSEPPPEPPPPAGNPDEACFPGSGMQWDQCVSLEQPSNLGSDYNYPSPLSGSTQYRAPVRYLDLQDHAGTMMIAPNFRLDEIAQEYKGRYAVVQPHAIDRLQDVRDQVGPLVVNSGYRPPGYNASVGGATHSRHMYGDAFDLDPANVSLSTLESACYSHGAGYVGVYSTHIHCDWRNDTVSIAFFGSSATSFSFRRPVFHGRIDMDGGALTAPADGWDEGEPLREWTAYDGDGYAIDTATGETYEPPADAASVEVVIGHELVRTVTL